VKIFAIQAGVFQAEPMTQPLALVLYERLLPGSQLVNRLQDLKYRVQAIAEPSRLVEIAEQSKPMVVLADIESSSNEVCGAISRLKSTPTTSHLPVIAFGVEEGSNLQKRAKESGATLIVSETDVLTYLPQFLEQALELE
jgi:PleD family two-component response regulator